MNSRSLRDRFFARDRSALARTLSFVEDHPDLAGTWIADLPPATRSKIIGITGPPGAGKSTLVNALIQSYRRQDLSVAVLAFDPSSRSTGGAALGDRIRMNETWNDDGIYIRSLANRGRLGGLSDAVFGSLRVLDSFGFDLVLIETVGVGQGEIEIADVADVTVLLQVPGTGDSIQLLKAGVFEIADILVVNKADLSGAGKLLHDLRSFISQGSESMSSTTVIATIATTLEGVVDLVDVIDNAFKSGTPDPLRRSHAEVRRYVIADLEHRLDDVLRSSIGRSIVDEVTSGEIGAWEASRSLVQRLAER